MIKILTGGTFASTHSTVGCIQSHSTSPRLMIRSIRKSGRTKSNRNCVSHAVNHSATALKMFKKTLSSKTKHAVSHQTHFDQKYSKLFAGSEIEYHHQEVMDNGLWQFQSLVLDLECSNLARRYIKTPSKGSRIFVSNCQKST